MASVDGEARLDRILAPGGRRAGRRWRLRAVALVLGAAMIAAGAWVLPFVRVPTRLPPGPDVPWYVWRTELLAGHGPDDLVGFGGPTGAFGGAYRVATPTLAALLRGVGGVDRYTVSTFLVVGWNVLAVLALGAAAYRWRRDPLLFALVVLFAAATFLLNPFVGWIDNMVALLLAAAALSFVPAARHSAGPRAALLLLLFVAFFAHPPAAGAMVVALAAAVALGGLLGGWRGVREEAGILAPAAVAAALGLLGWALGPWGAGRSFADAVNPPPYDRGYFLQAALNWVQAVRPARFVPLMAVGLAAVALSRRRFRSDPLARALVTWALPLLGLLSYLVIAFPYKRFLNVTAAPVLLAGIGLWAAIRVAWWAGRTAPPGQPPEPGARRGAAQRAFRGRWVGVLAALTVAALVLGPAWRYGSQSFDRRTPWMWPSVRSALAAVTAYAEHQPAGTPVVIVLAAGRRAPAQALYGEAWRGNWSVLRAGLPAPLLSDTYVYLGSARAAVAWRPTRTGNETFDLLSEASFRDIDAGVGDRRPMVFLIRPLSIDLGNQGFLGPPHAIPLGGDASLLLGPRFASPSADGVGAAREAAERAHAWRAAPPGPLAGPLDLLHGLVGLAFLLVVPGGLAARWFRVRDLPMALGTIPALSAAMNAATGLVVLSVARRPLSAAMAWLIVLLATAAGGVLGAVELRGRRARRRPTDVPGTATRAVSVAAGDGQGTGGRPVGQPAERRRSTAAAPASAARDRADPSRP